jgi:hypothetical protein
MKKIGIFSIIVSALLFSVFARAAPITFTASLAPEAAGATGGGSVSLVFDTTAHTLGITANWFGLSGTTTVAHVHCCTAVPGTGTVGVAVTPGTLPGFPVGVSAGNYNTVINLLLETNYTAGFMANFGAGTVGGSEAALLAGLQSGRAYFNVHTSTFQGGEIRGFPAEAVPEPMSLTLFAVALFGIFFAQRRTTSQAVRI